MTDTIFNDRRTGSLGDLRPRAHALYGAGSLEHMFGDSPKAPVPWKIATRSKVNRLYNPEIIRHGLSQPVDPGGLTDIDPRNLRATQPNLTRAGVAHYLGDQWRKTGQTFADQHQVGNRYPVVYHREDDDQDLLLSGHHRAGAALLRGEPLKARLFQGGWGPPMRQS